MGVTKTLLHNHIVYVDTDEPQRWVGVVGPSVTEWVFDASRYTADNYTVTAVNGSTIAQVDGAFGGEVVFTADTTANDGVQAQLLGEAFYLTGRYPAYFGCRFKLNDADQVDALVGLCVQDTTAIDAVADGAYFRTVDESHDLYFVLENTNVETVSAPVTLSDDTYVIAEFYYNGIDFIHAYLDGTLTASVALTDVNMPDDEYLTPILAMLTGENVGNTMTVDWARAYQICE